MPPCFAFGFSPRPKRRTRLLGLDDDCRRLGSEQDGYDDRHPHGYYHERKAVHHGSEVAYVGSKSDNLARYAFHCNFQSRQSFAFRRPCHHVQSHLAALPERRTRLLGSDDD